MLNYNGLEATSGLAPLGGGGSGTKGIAAHFGLATARRPLGVFEATMRDDKDESESVRWPLRQGAGNRARLSRHAGRDRVRPGRRRNCYRERSRRAPASWRAPAVRSGGACCARTAAKKGLWDGGTADAGQEVAEPRCLRRQAGAQETRGDAPRRPRPARAARRQDRRRSPLHARRVGRRTARPRLAVARDGGRTRERRRGAQVVRTALDGILQGPQVRHGRRRPAVRRRRRPSKVPRLRRHHRLPGLRPPAHGAGQARCPRCRNRGRR